MDCTREKTTCTTHDEDDLISIRIYKHGMCQQKHHYMSWWNNSNPMIFLLVCSCKWSLAEMRKLEYWTRDGKHHHHRPWNLWEGVTGFADIQARRRKPDNFPHQVIFSSLVLMIKGQLRLWSCGVHFVWIYLMYDMHIAWCVPTSTPASVPWLSTIHITWWF